MRYTVSTFLLVLMKFLVRFSGFHAYNYTLASVKLNMMKVNSLHYGSIGNLQLDTPYFIPHTEPSVSPPEFSIVCRTHGGPATAVRWALPNGTILASREYHDYEFSQIIVNSSHIELVYENRLLVRGRYNGTYHCTIKNNVHRYHSTLDEQVLEGSINVLGIYTFLVMSVYNYHYIMHSCW